MNKEDIKRVIERLLHEVEEEDIGISLFSTYCQAEDELLFFKEEDRVRILKIFKRVSEDSQRHKKILMRVIEHLGKKYHEN